MKKILVSFLAIFILTFSSYGQPLDLLKSVFIYNFANMVVWPNNSGGEFVIAVVGSSGVAKELQKMATSKKVGTQKIKVDIYSSVSEVSSCNILLISEDKKSELSSALSLKNTLIVSEEAGAAKSGAGISFVLVSGKVKFELSKSNLKAMGLKHSGTLEKLAIVVD